MQRKSTASSSKEKRLEGLFDRYRTDVVPRQDRVARHGSAKRLRALAIALDIEPAALLDNPPTDLEQLVDWMNAFPESDHGPVWLKAFEAGYQDQLLGTLTRARATSAAQADLRESRIRATSVSIGLLHRCALGALSTSPGIHRRE